MKKIAITFYLIITVFTSLFSQVFDPVSWSFSVETIQSETYIVAKAKIDKGWHLYSQYLENDLGPVPTAFSFKPNNNYTLVGKTEEKSKKYSSYDSNFEMNVVFFKTEAIFKQKIKLKSAQPFSIKGNVDYMVCDDEKCLPPTNEEFEVSIVGESVKQTSKTSPLESGLIIDNVNPVKEEKQSNIYDPVNWKFRSIKINSLEYDLIAEATIDAHWHVYATKLSTNDGPVPTEFKISTNDSYTAVGKVKQIGKQKSSFDKNFDAQLEYFENKLELVQRIKLKNEKDSTITVSGEVYFMTCDDEKCLPPVSIPFQLNLKEGNTVEDSIQEKKNVNNILPTLPKFDLENPVNDCGGEKDIADKSIWVLFLLGLGGGLFSILTPCVYPMIPLTVSFFTKGGKERGNGLWKAGLYGTFIALIYVSLSIPFHISNPNPEILNEIATNPILNLVFFLIFVFFALSFLGYYELTLPSKWSNQSDEASNKGGVIGIFFMALTLALVSFSCTGPILGSVLAGVLKNGAWPLTAALAGFGIALGLPFAIFAAFPSLMQSIPQSGGWLNSVKVTLGFLELALAVKFLSSADLVLQLGLIKRELFFAIWIVLGIGLMAYFLNIIRFPHDSPNRKLTFSKIALAALTLSFVIYLLPGLTCGENANRKLVSGFAPPVFYSYCNNGNCPLNLACVKDLDEGLALAKQTGKPILLDFTGWACVNCREVEESIWTNEQVFKIISEKYILVSLYVDDERKLKESEQGTVPITYDNGKVKNKKIKTIGDKWSTFETLFFKNNTQPLYALITAEGELLNNPISYTDIQKKGGATYYTSFLNCGLDAYTKINH